ncbi:MAG: M48 family metallopeptidase [Pseudomonadota bacterium]
MRWILVLGALVLSGCVATTQSPQGPSTPPQTVNTTPDQNAVARFESVVARVEPVAEGICRQQLPGGNCDFLVQVDTRPNQPPNAFQSLDRDGRPILAFNTALIASVRNADELAFVFSHEAAHHIAGHIPKTVDNARTGAILLGGLAALTGAGSGTVEAALDLGAGVGARTYSKDFELEADALGTVIAKRSGYDPVRGAEFFTQIPDPGDVFLGTHPPNAERIATVRRVAAGL